MTNQKTDDRFADLALIVLAICCLIALAMSWPAQGQVAAANHIIDGGSNPIAIAEIRQDQPEFERVYTATIGNGIAVKIRLKMFLGTLYDEATLTQRDGKYIIFDVHAVADKVIDPRLLPYVQNVVNRVLAADKKYRHSQPMEFTDDTGTTWRRMEKK